MFINIPSQVKNYEVEVIVGYGSSSVVYQGRNIKTGETVALKFVSRSIFQKPVELEHFEKELRVLPLLHHKNIAKYIETVFTNDYIVVVMEMLECQLLPPSAIDPRSREYILLRWAKEILEALSYLHKHGIAHMDIKPENIGFDYYMQIKLFDFGLCTFSKQNKAKLLCKDKCGTIPFAAPEIILKEEYDGSKADIWSFGVTMYYIATQEIPFIGVNNNNFMKRAANIADYLNIDIEGPLGEIIKLALTPDPDKRPSADDLLNTNYFDNAEKIRYQISSTLIKSAKARSSILPPIRKPNIIKCPAILLPYRKQVSEKSIRIYA